MAQASSVEDLSVVARRTFAGRARVSMVCVGLERRRSASFTGQDARPAYADVSYVFEA
jgi:hypothetical protein